MNELVNWLSSMSPVQVVIAMAIGVLFVIAVLEAIVDANRH